jgi:two-component system chemotaxis response regulator CheB
MIRILIVDDQLVVRNILEEALKKYSFIEVVGKAPSALEAKRLIPIIKPDLITLDVEMPGMSGVEFLDWLIPNYHVPVLMLSSYTEVGAEITLEALSKGAMDFVQKPDGTEADFSRMLKELAFKIKKIGSIKTLKTRTTTSVHNLEPGNKLPKKEKSGKIRLIAIGASTGGTQAIDFIVTHLPNNLPPIVIVQHMPEHFTKLFANRLAITTGLKVKEAENGDLLEEGNVYIAPGNKHLLVRRMAGKLLLEIEFFDKVSGHRPSIDVFFKSIADGKFSETTLAILLTGMGKDGANGLLSIRQKGGRTLGQDEASSTVYGMPKEAFLLSAVEKQVSLENFPSEILNLI